MWEIAQNSRVLFGSKKIGEIAGIFQWYQLKKIFIVTYDANAEALVSIKRDLESKNISYYVYDKVKTEPDLFVIDEGSLIAIKEKCDGVLGIGGGSVLDTAKAIAMLAVNGGTIEEYQMNGKSIDHDALPLIAVPTTAGTGSEATKVSVIYNNHNGLKKSVYSPCMIANVVILDPEVTINLPAGITASTGIDALSHAIESYVSLNATDYTEMYSLKAMELISKSLVKAVNDGNNIEARGDMMLASYMAGCALNAGIGIAHIIAQPLGGVFKIPHGDACSIFLPLSMEFNLSNSTKKYRKIGEILLGRTNDTLDDVRAANLAINKVIEIIDNVGTPKDLSKFVDAKTLDMNAVMEKVMGSTGHIKCNPRLVDRELLQEIITKAL